jgi:hypothetical protein
LDISPSECFSNRKRARAGLKIIVIEVTSGFLA